MEKIVSLDPNDILANDNIRFGLTKDRIQRLADQIERDGQVHQPIAVELLPEPVDDKLYRLVTGHYRRAAVELLHKKGLAMDLPAIITQPGDDLQRIKRQISENAERENLSPMDEAVTIRRLLSQNVTRQDVRGMFARRTGRKNKIEPVSNSFLNMRTSFLDLPKDIQERIHDGRLGVKAAYELTTYSPEKRKALLDKAEKERLDEIDRQEKLEAKFLKDEADAAKVTTELEQTQAQATELTTDLQTAEENVKKALAAETEAFNADRASKAKGVAKAEREKAAEHFKAAQALARSAEKVLADKKAEEEKLKKKLDASAKKAEDLKAKLAAKRAEKKADPNKRKQTAVSQRDIAKAAKQEGAKSTKDTSSGLAAMNGTETKKMIAEMASAAGSYPKVQAIFKAFDDCIQSKTTPQALYTALAKITGEYVAPKGAVAAAVASKPAAKK